MKLLWDERAWEDYCYWQTQDKKTLKRINALIRDIQRSSYDGIRTARSLSPPAEAIMKDKPHLQKQGRFFCAH